MNRHGRWNMTLYSGRGSEPSRDCSMDTHAAAFADWLSSKMEAELLERVKARRLRYQEGASLVLIVDDEPVLAITLAEILRRRKLNAVWFTDPLDALQYVELGAVDLLLSDFTMPPMDGVVLATEVRKLIPECLVFLFSAVCEEPEVSVRMKALGTGVHIEAKPLSVPNLISTVEAMLFRHSDTRADAQTVTPKSVCPLVATPTKSIGS
jgi:CheY-like chemotaxis protein